MLQSSSKFLSFHARGRMCHSRCSADCKRGAKVMSPQKLRPGKISHLTSCNAWFFCCRAVTCPCPSQAEQPGACSVEAPSAQLSAQCQDERLSPWPAQRATHELQQRRQRREKMSTALLYAAEKGRRSVVRV